MSLDSPPSPLHVELSQHFLGQLIRVELASTGKLYDPDRYKLDNGHGFGPCQPQAGADLLLVHRVDLVRVKKKGGLALTVGFAQSWKSLCGAPPYVSPVALVHDTFMNEARADSDGFHA
jgi:hypothetical protein